MIPRRLALLAAALVAAGATPAAAAAPLPVLAPSTAPVTASPTGSPTAPLLPGETVMPSQHGGRAVPSYLFGVNDGINYLSGSDVLDGNKAVQAELRAGRLTLDRIWAYATDSDATIMAKVAAMKAAGMSCMVMLGSPGDRTWLDHTVAMLYPTCRIFEWGNEPDNGGGNIPIAQATADWNANVPHLRALAPRAVFGGPAVAGAGGRDSSAGSYPSDVAYFLAKAAPHPAFVSFHDYGCGPGVASTEAECLHGTQNSAAGDLRYNAGLVYGWERQYLGHTIATGVTEYNFDPGSQNLYSWGTLTPANERFQYAYTQEVLREAAALGLSFAVEWTSMNYSAYGLLDMFVDSPGYRAKPYFYAIVDLAERHGSGSTVPIPTYGASS